MDLIHRRDAIEECKLEFLNPNVERETKELTLIDQLFAKGWNQANSIWIKALEKLPSVQPEREILDELMAIMKEYYFTHRYEYDEAWENGFAKCMNLIPNVYMKREKDR